jgi:hypothetical protein
VRPYPGERPVLTTVMVAGGSVRLEGLDIRGTVELLPGTSRVELVRNRSTTDGRYGGANLSIDPGVSDVLVAGNRFAQRAGAGDGNVINFSSTDTQPAIEDVTIRGNRIGPVPGGGDAIQAKHTRGLVIEGNEIFGVSAPPGSGSHPDAFQSIYGAERLVLRRNFIHDIDSQGIFIERFRGENRGLLAEDNVIVRVDFPWVEFTFSALGAKIVHNTIEGRIRSDEDTRGAVLVANIVSSFLIAPGAETEAADNLLEQLTGPQGPGSIVGQPVYRDPAANDFRLAPGSPGSGMAANGADIGARRADYGARR